MEPKIEQVFLERSWSRLERYAQKTAKKRIISAAMESLLWAEASYQSLCGTDSSAIPVISPPEQLSAAFKLLEKAYNDAME